MNENSHDPKHFAFPMPTDIHFRTKHFNTKNDNDIITIYIVFFLICDMLLFLQPIASLFMEFLIRKIITGKRASKKNHFNSNAVHGNN